MIDCHAHLADSAFAADLEDVLDRSRLAGVSRIICVCEKVDDNPRVLHLAHRYPVVLPCLGLHPDAADMEQARQVVALIEAHSAAIVAIGEVGLDYWVAKDEGQRARQREVLALFARTALELDLPLNVHSRSAGHHTLDLLLQQGSKRVLMHAFDGKASAALAGVEAGYLFSVPPSVLRSPQKQKLVRRLPLSSLLLESDSPVLGPTREERNEPCNIRLCAQAISSIKECALDEVLEVTTENARSLFGLG